MWNTKKTNKYNYFGIATTESATKTSIIHQSSSLDEATDAWIQERKNISNEKKPIVMTFTFDNIPILVHDFASKYKTDDCFVEMLPKDELTKRITDSVFKLGK
jgi:hypothetical protein